MFLCIWPAAWLRPQARTVKATHKLAFSPAHTGKEHTILHVHPKRHAQELPLLHTRLQGQSHQPKRLAAVISPHASQHPSVLAQLRACEKAACPQGAHSQHPSAHVKRQHALRAHKASIQACM
eukprot:1159296-Pelagomonas_calceolata.AAC.4